ANLLAYNLTTGNLITSWAPTTNGDVLSIAASPDKSRIYIGGSFTQVNGVIKNRIAALDPTTGALIGSFSASPDATVRAVVPTNDTVYFAGLFSNVGGVARPRAAAVTTTGGLLSWSPNVQGGLVRAMVMSPDGSQLLLGGAFTSVNGSSNPGYGLAAVSSATGASLPWAANSLVRNGGSQAAITSLVSDNDSVYATGYVFGAGGNLEGTARMSWNGGTTTWVEDCHGDTYDSYPAGDVVYAVSHAHYCGNLPDGFPQTDPWTFHWGTAFSKAVAGTLKADPFGYFNWAGTASPNLLKWLPKMASGTYTGQGQAGWTVTGNDKYVVYGGEFPTAGSGTQQGLVRYAVRDIAPNKIGPELTGSKINPSLTSFAKGTVKLSWTANWDRDNEQLTYSVIRDGDTANPIYTTTQLSSEWSRPPMGFLDTGLTAGQSYRYRVFVKDPLGNEARSDTVTIVASADGEISPYAQGVLHDNPANYWRLGESSGATVTDWAGFNNATTGSGVTRGAEGAIIGDTNTASTFDGTANGTAIPGASQVGSDTFTAEAWIKTTTTSGGKIIGFGSSNTGDSGSYDRHVYMTNSGQLIFGVYPGGVQTVGSSKAYNDGQWHHVVASLGSGGMALYVDGQRVGSRTDVTSAQPYVGYWRVGGDNIGGWPSQPSSNYFNGAIDDVAIYPTVLSAAQVRTHFTNSGRTLPGSTAPADAYGKAVYADEPDLFWRLAETSGTTAADVTPNQLPGAYSGGVTLNQPGVSGDAAVTLDGVNGAVASNNTFSNPTTYAEELWFKTTTTRGGKLIGFGSSQFGGSGSYDRHVYMFDDGRLRFGVWTGQTNVIDTSASYNDGTWHHLVAQQGSNGMQLFVDDQLVGTNPQTQAQGYTGYWRVGGDTTWGGNSSNYFAGSIDDVAVYSKTLSQAQITDHFLKGGGQVPNVNPTADFTSTVTKQTVTFDGTGSSDSDGTIASYAWDFGDGATSTQAKPSHTFAAAGDQTVKLTVTDNQGATDSVTKTVTTVDNAKPTAAFTYDVNNLAVSFDGSGSSDSDGTVASYSWDFGDGATSTAAKPNHTYASAGDQTVKLTVTDNDGSTDSVTKSVTTVAPTGPLAQDGFARSTSNGWGSADIGGTWTRYGTASLFSVADGTGQIRLATAGSGPRIALESVSSTSSDVSVKVSLDKIAGGGGSFVSVGARTIGTNDYRTKIKIGTNGALTLYLVKVVNNAETALVSTNLGSAFNYAAGGTLNVRVQATGTAPTTVKAKVWKTTQTEPTAWQLTTTDSESVLQAPGGVAVVGYLSGSATGMPIVLRVDDLSVDTAP
ncbi:MAG TPA: LamG-like jellyroll fold domain-containing protein, partial [Microlunatus sp.]|nr:LamG-like jellyroll fold domain-containing protein [Microlunatus sp.]